MLTQQFSHLRSGRRRAYARHMRKTMLPHRKHALSYGRHGDGDWLRDEIEGEGDIAIPFLETRVMMAKLYEDVSLPPLAVKEGEEWDEDGREDDDAGSVER